MGLSELQRDFRACADADDALFMMRFYKTAPGSYGAGDRFLGIRVPLIRRFVSKYAPAMSHSEVLELLSSPYHEERMLALLILVRNFECGDEKTRKLIYTSYLEHTRFINNWDLVDQSAAKIVGAGLFEISDEKTLCRLAKSSLLWDRRIAIVATHYFIRREVYDPTLKIAEMLLGDGEDLIHKACGWMLREVGKRNMAAEEVFLREHCRRMPRVMLRYAIERFPEKLRQKYLQC